MEFRAGGDRGRTHTDWLDSRHSFSFGPHYEPDNIGFGLLLAHNEDVLAPGAGFDSHPHRDLEIVTWVLQGCLLHEDRDGNRQLVGPGMVQVSSAASGITHAELNASPDEPVHLVQMWLSPERPGGAPAYACAEVSSALTGGRLVPIVSGAGPAQGGLRVRQRDAVLLVARLAARESVRLPAAAFLHLFIARGSVAIEGVPALSAHDALRVSGADGELVSAGDMGAELLMWQMHSALG